MVNSNPETVSTDFDASTRLYFEPLDPESVRSIIAFESGGDRLGARGHAPRGRRVRRPDAAQPRRAAGRAPGVPLLGSSLETIDQAEERTRFSALLDRLGIPQPEGGMAESIEEALTLAERIGYPVIVRPSFVIGGLAIDFAYSPEDLVRHLAAAAIVDPDRPVRIDRFLEGIEVDVDAVCDGHGGAHPGPARARRARRRPLGRLDRGVPAAARRRGRPRPDRVDDGADLPRARRTRPRQRAVHRARRRRVPDRGQPARLADRAVHVQGDRACRWSSWRCGSRSARRSRELGWAAGLRPDPPFVAVKAPAFSTAKLKGVDPSVGPFMQSTGEVIGIADDAAGRDGQGADRRVADPAAAGGPRARRRSRCSRSPTATSGACWTSRGRSTSRATGSRRRPGPARRSAQAGFDGRAGRQARRGARGPARPGSSS